MKYKTYEELKEELGDKFEEYMYGANINLLTIIDKLKTWLKHYIKLMNTNPDVIETGQIDILHEVLDKIKELESVI